MTDCKTTVAGDVITVAECRVYGLGTSFYESYSLAGGTVTRTTGTESADIYIVVNYNGGSPILKAIIGTGITLGNYASSGITRVSANVPEAGDKVLSLVSVSSGVIGAPSERRGMFDVSTFTGGTGISIAGRTITATTAVQAQERVMHVKWWGTGASSVLQDTDDELTVFRNRYTNTITINSVVCETDTGTPTVQLQKDDGSATNMLSSNLTCDGTPTTTFVSGENTMAAGDRLDGLIVSAGGSAHWVAITVSYTVN